jgi:FkbM family methyltransferase
MTGDAVDFTLQGVKLRVPAEFLTPKIVEVLNAQRYEKLEAQQVARFMRNGDRLLEFGGGLGYISSVAARAASLEYCAVIEANPGLIPVIETNHSLNGVSANVIHGVALADGIDSPYAGADGKMQFNLTPNFWGASTSSRVTIVNTIRVPVYRTSALLKEHRPNVIIADIEGAELEVFENVNLNGVDRIFFELHKNLIGLQGIRRLFDSLSRQGLVYDPDFSVGATVLCTRAR